MLPPGLGSPRQVTLYYDSLYYDSIASGKFVPFTYPWAGIAAILVFGYLLIDHRRNRLLRWFRFPAFGFLVYFQIWCMITNRARHPAAALGVGLLSAWGMLWVAVIMVVNDCQLFFRRIERSGPHVSHIEQNGKASTPSQSESARIAASTSRGGMYEFHWASYPDKFLERLNWVADVFCNFRGIGWNWQVSVVPPAPKHVELALRGEQQPPDSRSADVDEMTVSKTGIRRFNDRAALLRESLIMASVGYLILDIVKTVMHRDAYFWGYMAAPAPAYLLPLVGHSRFLLQAYRLTVSLTGVYTCLATIFKLGPLFFCGILGPEWIGVRGEAWMNPADMFGSFDNVLDRGLAGWWAGWWHQIFRFGFEAPATRLLELMRVNKRTPLGSLISLFIAFFLSGCLHASGSYTQMGETRPLLGPMRFFLLQAVAITAQTLATRQLAKFGVLEKLPRSIKRFSNFVLVHAWLYFTAPLLMDDFAKGGVWLFEPIAISPLRGMGLGAADDGWWCWWNGLVSWRRGDHYWDTGLAI